MALFDENTEPKLTPGTKISKSLLEIINRLQDGHSVDMEDIMKTPEVQLGEQVLSECPKDTMMLDPEVRRPLRNGIEKIMFGVGSYTGDNEDGKPQYDGPVEQGRRLHVVVGLPASGKSTGLVDVISKEFSAKVLDNDMTKELIPEFWDGWGSGSVHNESKMLTNRVMEKSMALGENIVLPKLGCPPDSLKTILEMAKQYDYSVDIHMMEVDPNKALGRLLGRFVQTGRYINPEWMQQFTTDPEFMRKSFDKLREGTDGYSVWTNNVNYGEKPILKEYGGDVEGDFIAHARRDIENEQVVEPESEFVEQAEKLSIKSIIIGEEIDGATVSKNESAARIVNAMREHQSLTEKQSENVEKMLDKNTPAEEKAAMARKSEGEQYLSTVEALEKVGIAPDDAHQMASDFRAQKKAREADSQNKPGKIYTSLDALHAAKANMDKRDAEREESEALPDNVIE